MAGGGGMQMIKVSTARSHGLFLVHLTRQMLISTYWNTNSPDACVILISNVDIYGVCVAACPSGAGCNNTDLQCAHRRTEQSELFFGGSADSPRCQSVRFDSNVISSRQNGQLLPAASKRAGTSDINLQKSNIRFANQLAGVFTSGQFACRQTNWTYIKQLPPQQNPTLIVLCLS